MIAHGFHRIGNGDLGKLAAIGKGVRAYLLDAFVYRKVRKSAAAKKSTIADVLDRGGYFYFRKRRACLECAVADALQPLRQRNACQIYAGIKGVGAYSADIAAQHYSRHARNASESAVGNGGDRLAPVIIFYYDVALCAARPVHLIFGAVVDQNIRAARFVIFVEFILIRPFRIGSVLRACDGFYAYVIIAFFQPKARAVGQIQRRAAGSRDICVHCCSVRQNDKRLVVTRGYLHFVVGCHINGVPGEHVVYIHR